MTKKAGVFLVLGLLLVLAGVAAVTKIFFLTPAENAALQTNSFPLAQIFLDNTPRGQTPLTLENLRTGEHLLKLSANVAGQTVNYETKIKLTEEALTYVNWELSDKPEMMAGEIFFLEKLPAADKGEIMVISEPTGAVIKINGNPSGQTPLALKSLSPAEYEIAVSANGYKERFLRGKVMAGYRLNVIAQLAAGVATTAPTTAAPAASQSAQVIIKETPTGWLRVRMEPNIAATEAGRVNPGEKYLLLEETEGWVKIKFKENLAGWVSGSYVTKVK